MIKTFKKTSREVGFPNIVHDTDLNCAKDVMEKIRFSEIRVKAGKGDKPRPCNRELLSENWKNIKWT